MHSHLPLEATDGNCLYRSIGHSPWYNSDYPLTSLDLALTILSSVASWAGTYALSGPLTRTQKCWIQATGARLECTNSMISHMEEVKLSGLTGVFSSTIQNLRNIEIAMAEKCRLLLSWTATLCKIIIESIHRKKVLTYML